jgi:hypothetical protein
MVHTWQSFRTTHKGKSLAKVSALWKAYKEENGVESKTKKSSAKKSSTKSSSKKEKEKVTKSSPKSKTLAKNSSEKEKRTLPKLNREYPAWPSIYAHARPYGDIEVNIPIGLVVYEKNRKYVTPTNFEEMEEKSRNLHPVEAFGYAIEKVLKKSHGDDLMMPYLSWKIEKSEFSFVLQFYHNDEIQTNEIDNSKRMQLIFSILSKPLDIKLGNNKQIGGIYIPPSRNYHVWGLRA